MGPPGARADPSSQDEADDDAGLLGVVSAMIARVRAEGARFTTITEIALIESRVAATSVLLLLGVALLAVVLVLLVWLLLVALITVGLAALGLGVASALGIVLVLHLAALGALGFFGYGLLAHLRFERTRKALASDDDSDEDDEFKPSA